MTTHLILNANGQTLARHPLQHGQTLRIAARPNTQYQLLDPQNGESPEYVQLLRQGDDLHILIQDEGTIILDNYYAIDPSGTLNPVLGAQHGQTFIYPPNTDLPHLLAGEINPAANPLATGNPDIPALTGLLGIVALGASAAVIANNRDDDNPGFIPQPQSPFDPNG